MGESIPEVESFRGCERCASTGGFIYTEDSEGNPVAERCECLREYQYRRNLLLGLRRAGIPPSIIDYDVNSYVGSESVHNVQKLKTFLHHFWDRFHSVHLYLHGPNSTQKTTLAQWLGRELIAKDASVKYVLMDDLIRTLMQEGFEEEAKSKVKGYYEADCLIVDEAFDKEKVNWYKSGYQLTFLDRFVRYRLEQSQRSTIFVSNKSVATLSRSFGESIYELINRNTSQSQLSFEDHYASGSGFDPSELWEEDT